MFAECCIFLIALWIEGRKIVSMYSHSLLGSGSGLRTGSAFLLLYKRPMQVSEEITVDTRPNYTSF